MNTLATAVIVIVVLVAAALFFLRRAGSESAPDVAVLSRLRQAGSDLTRPHAIEFFLYFPSQEAARRVGFKLEQQGFSVAIQAGAGQAASWLALATKSMVPEVSELVRLRTELTSAAAAEGGNYDGWGSPVVK